MRLPKTVNICGKVYKILRDRAKWGGSCYTGNQEITVTSHRTTSSHRQVCTYIHEIMEAVTLERNLRFESSDEEVRFVMTHKQFDDFTKDVTTALLPLLKGEKT